MRFKWVTFCRYRVLHLNLKFICWHCKNTQIDNNISSVIDYVRCMAFANPERQYSIMSLVYLTFIRIFVSYFCKRQHLEMCLTIELNVFPQKWNEIFEKILRKEHGKNTCHLQSSARQYTASLEEWNGHYAMNGDALSRLGLLDIAIDCVSSMQECGMGETQW